MGSAKFCQCDENRPAGKYTLSGVSFLIQTFKIHFELYRPWETALKIVIRHSNKKQSQAHKYSVDNEVSLLLNSSSPEPDPSFSTVTTHDLFPMFRKQ